MFKILDVGGYKGKTAEFHTDDEVYICDILDVKEKNYVKGDGRKLPFTDAEFDFVVSFDTYEHVPREDRRRFVSELIRVSKRGIILAAPFDDKSGAVFKAEVDLNSYYKKLYRKDHQWLKEHIDYRIPSVAELDSLLDKLSMPYVRLGSNDLAVWILMQCIYFSIELDEDLRGRVDDVNRHYNREMQALDIAAETNYRQIYFFSKLKDNVKQISNFINEQKNAARGGLKTQFFAYALIVFGQKYRDLELYKQYLESEIQKLKSEREHLKTEQDQLKAEQEKLKKEIDLLRMQISQSLPKRIYKKLRKS